MAISVVRLALAAAVTGTLLSLRRQARERMMERRGPSGDADMASGEGGTESDLTGSYGESSVGSTAGLSGGMGSDVALQPSQGGAGAPGTTMFTP